jgi:ankyrin repeat protein
MVNINTTLAEAIYTKFKQEQKKNHGEPEWFLCEPNSENSTPDVIWSKEETIEHYNNTLRMRRKFPHQNEWAYKSLEILNQMSVHDLSPNDHDIHIAVKMGFPSIVTKILQFDNINVNNKLGFSGRTPLHECLCNVNVNMKILYLLVAAGASFDIPDNEGETCLNIVILFFNNTGQEWLPLLIMDHIFEYDYGRINHNGENLLEYAKIMNAQPCVLKKIESMTRYVIS